MKTNNKFHDPTQHDLNRERFAIEQDIRSQKQRNGLFSMPLGVTIGDGSTNYQTYRKERHEVGAVKPYTVNPCGDTKQTFGKLESNAIGNPYVDPGQYDLRKPGPRGAGTGCINSTMRSQSMDKTFKYSGSQKLVRRSEFEHMHNGPPKKVEPETKKGFLTSSVPEPFTNMNTIGYSIEPYERKQDMERTEYAK